MRSPPPHSDFHKVSVFCSFVPARTYLLQGGLTFRAFGFEGQGVVGEEFFQLRLGKVDLFGEIFGVEFSVGDVVIEVEFDAIAVEDEGVAEGEEERGADNSVDQHIIIGIW